MSPELGRALKEWAVACEALRMGAQTVLLRKGGIREEEGVFRIDDQEFLLLPTWEHQQEELLQQVWAERLRALQGRPPDPSRVRIDACARVDCIWKTDEEEALRALESRHIWNERFLTVRLNYSPYDPLYVLLVRAYALPDPQVIPMRPAYAGCRSWVTLERPLSTAGAEPALDDDAFAAVRGSLVELLGEPRPGAAP